MEGAPPKVLRLEEGTGPAADLGALWRTAEMLPNFSWFLRGKGVEEGSDYPKSISESTLASMGFCFHFLQFHAQLQINF